MIRALVIGATGVAGSAGIAALRERFGDDINITGVWYGRKPDEIEIDGTDRTLFGDITEPGFLDEIATKVSESFDWCLYATALGDVGFPVSEATDEQIRNSNRLSFDPMLVLEERFDITHMVAYSTFYNLDHQRITYGAMGHSKYAIEQWALKSGKSRHICLRAGAFRSASSQGIKLLIRRRAKALAESNDPLLRSFFANIKPSIAVENLETAVFAEEREVYGDTETDVDGIRAAHLAIFDAPETIFMNVCGKRVWSSAEVLPLA